MRPSTVLERVPNIRIEMDARDQLRIVTARGEIVSPSHGLDLLRLFSHPTSVEAALESLRVRGVREWVEASGTIMSWVRLGLLREPGAAGDDPVARTGYEAAPVHAAMLNDRSRTSAFIRAIESAIAPGDVVVDIGTGTGILAMAAARAGAAHVFAIEASSMAACAAQVFAANGFADRITLVRGRSTEVTLSARADLIVTEMIGHHPLGEGLLEVVADALARLAKPGARVVPGGLKLLGIPMELPPDDLAAYSASAASLAAWKEWYGFELGPVGSRTANSCFLVRPEKAARWKPLAPPATLARFDLAAPHRDLLVEATAETEANQEGELNAVVLAMDLELGRGNTLTTQPHLASATNHWLSPVWLPSRSTRLRRGQKVRLHFAYGTGLHGRQGFVDAVVAPEDRP